MSDSSDLSKKNSKVTNWEDLEKYFQSGNTFETVRIGSSFVKREDREMSNISKEQLPDIIRNINSEYADYIPHDKVRLMMLVQNNVILIRVNPAVTTA